MAQRICVMHLQTIRCTHKSVVAQICSNPFGVYQLSHDYVQQIFRYIFFLVHFFVNEIQFLL